MLVGAFGPWAKVLGIVTINGTDGGRDGWIVVGAAAFAAVFLLIFLRLRKRWLLTLPILAGVVGAATAGYDISDINGLYSNTLGISVVDTEWGIYVALVGSISLVLASIGLWLETKRRVVAPDVAEMPPPSPG
jgi:uncharacterized membrane protein